MNLQDFLSRVFPKDNLDDGAGVVGILFLLGILTSIEVYQRFVLIPRLRARLAGFNAVRARSIQEALASTSQSTWPTPVEALPYPFVGWVEFVEADGAVKVANEVFPIDQPFEAVARDTFSTIRASVKSDGRGEVHIFSHGEHFLARYGNGQWKIETIEL